MTTVSGNFTSVSVSGVLVARLNEPVTISLSGTYNCTTVLERASTNAELQWVPVLGPFNTANATLGLTYTPQRAEEHLRLRVISYTSGTLAYSMSDSSLSLFNVSDNGSLILLVTEDGYDFRKPIVQTFISDDITASVKSAAYFTTAVKPRADSEDIRAGVWGVVDYQGAGNVINGGHLIGTLGWTQISVAKTIALAVGAEGKLVNNISGASITNGLGVESNVTNVAGATFGNCFFYNTTLSNSGTITNLVGFRFADFSAISGVTNKHAFRSEDPQAAVLRKAGTGANACYVDMGGLCAQNEVSVGSPADTNFNVLLSEVIPAATLKNNGDEVHVKVFFRTAANANNKTVGLRIGANSITLGPTAWNNKVGWFEGVLTRTGANTQSLVLRGHMSTTLAEPLYFAATESEGSDINLWALGQNGTASANDIVVIGISAVYHPAPK